MYKSDMERFYRMALSRMEMAHDEIEYIRNNIYDSGDMAEAELALGEAIEFFADGRDEASRYLGFEVRAAMKT